MGKQSDILSKIPKVVKHMTVAIYKSGDIGGSKANRFKTCFAIARAQLARNGYLSKGSAAGPVDNIKLAGKGHRLEAEHDNEGGGGRDKTDRFDAMYAWVEAKDPTPITATTKAAAKVEAKKASLVAKQEEGPPGVPKPKVGGIRSREEAMTKPVAKKPKW